MIKHLFQVIGGIESFGIISICLFFAVFGVVLLMAFCHKRPFLTAMSSLPLNDGECTRKGDDRHE